MNRGDDYVIYNIVLFVARYTESAYTTRKGNLTMNEDKIMTYMKTPNFLVLFTFSTTIILTIAWIFLVKHENRIIETNIEPSIIADSSNYLMYIDNLTWKRDNISNTKDYINIEGWLIKPGEEVKTAAIKIVFQDTETGKYYIIPTTMVERDSVTEYFADGLSYKYSGFSVRIPYFNELDTNKDYSLYALYSLNDNQALVSFNTTLKTWGG